MATTTWMQKGVRMLTAVIIGYALVVLLAALFQRRLLYFPTKLSPEQAEQTGRREGFVPWKNKSGQTIGWQLPANGSPSGTVLVVHGNAGYALDRGYICEPIHAAAALDVYVLEYPGYGARPGSPSMKSFLAAGEEAFSALPTNRPVYLVGESIGAGVVAHLARTYPDKVAGLLLFAPYDDLGSVAQRQMPILPTKWILRDRFRPAAWLADYRGPVKVVLAERDEIIPVMFGRRLYDAYNGPKELQVVPAAGHNDIAEQSPDWWRDVLSFWAKHGVTRLGTAQSAAPKVSPR